MLIWGRVLGRIKSVLTMAQEVFASAPNSRATPDHQYTVSFSGWGQLHRFVPCTRICHKIPITFQSIPYGTAGQAPNSESFKEHDSTSKTTYKQGPILQIPLEKVKACRKSLYMGPKDHMNRRILHSGSTAQYILVFVWSFGSLL